MLHAVFTVMYWIVGIAPNKGQLISNLENSPWTITDSERNCELQCISHGLMYITYSETCVNVNDGNPRMGQLLKNWQHSLILREVSGIAVASYSLFNSNLFAITVYTLEEHCSMVLGIVDTATTMFPFFNNW